MIEGVMPLWMFSFAHFSCACFEIELLFLILLIFLHIILSVKCIINNSLLEFSGQAYYAPFAVL